jgi:hypothetical protein
MEVEYFLWALAQRRPSRTRGCVRRMRSAAGCGRPGTTSKVSQQAGPAIARTPPCPPSKQLCEPLRYSDGRRRCRWPRDRIRHQAGSEKYHDNERPHGDQPSGRSSTTWRTPAGPGPLVGCGVISGGESFSALRRTKHRSGTGIKTCRSNVWSA